MFKKLYQTLKQFDDIIIVSDGDDLVGLYMVVVKIKK